MCRHIRASSETKDIPVIFLTTIDSQDEIIKGLKLGAVDYITKPFSTPELLARVNVLLELKRKRDVILEMNIKLQKEIRDRILAQKALSESNEKFKVISEKMAAMKPGDFIHPEDRPNFIVKLEKLISGDLSSAHHQYRGVSENDSIIYLEDYKARITLRDEPAVIGTIIDITHKKAMEEALSEKNLQLEQLDKSIVNISTEARELLGEQQWPGNIRELKSVMRRAVLFCQGKSIITDNVLQAMNPKAEVRATPAAPAGVPVTIPQLTMDELEKWGIREALRLTDGKKMEAASLLKIGYSTLKRKMSKYGIESD